jgi:hypothetical protein
MILKQGLSLLGWEQKPINSELMSSSSGAKFLELSHTSA